MLSPGHPATTASRVTPVMYVGGYLAAADPALVRQMEFTHILKLFADDPGYRGGAHRHPGVEYLVIDAEDDPSYPLDRHFNTCLAFIRRALGPKPPGERPGRILVHCHAGVSRSVSIVTLHLMVDHGLSLQQALRLVKSRRPPAQPNPGFLRLLRAVETRLSERGHKSRARQE